jgi:RNA polymerase primary sigma factor
MNALSTYFKDIGNFDIIDSDEQTKLVLLAQKGDKEAQDKLINSNLKFVVTIARQYLGQGMPLEDLISEGNLGIIKAIEYYNTNHDTKFLTYASWWIRQSILSALTEQNRQVRLPANRIGIIQQYNKAVIQMEQELNRSVSDNEVISELGLDASDVVRQFSVSYNVELEEGTTLLDLLPNPESESPDAGLIRESQTQEIRRALKMIPERECMILKLYYGFDEPRSYTLEEIGVKLSLTRERIRQLRNKAIKDLRRLNRRKKLENLKD